jgi:hypothetical protein
MKRAVRFMNATSAMGISPPGPHPALVYDRSLCFDIRKAQPELGRQPYFDGCRAN